MKKKLQAVPFLLCALVALVGAVSGTVSWFIEKVTIDEQSGLVGESQGAYFARGDGTSAKPFIINRPIHLYNLSWLQYIGYFNNAHAPYFFALDPEDGVTTLDMTGWVLPPIGTSLYPFVGQFDGHGETIQNLTVDNQIGKDHIVKTPTFITDRSIGNNQVLKVYKKGQTDNVSAGTFLTDTVDVVGFFGFLGTYSGMASVGGNYANDNRVDNVALDELSVVSGSAKALGGLGVGYMNAPVSGMGISDSSISFAADTAPVSSITENLSDFSTVGFAAPAYRSAVSSYRTSAVVPARSTTSGTGSEGGHELDWGGSIDFKEIFNRLDNLYDNRAKPYWRGIYSEAVTQTVTNVTIGGVPTEEETSSSTMAYYDGATSATPQSFDSNLLSFDSTHDKTNAYDPLEGKVAFHEINSTSSSTAYDYQYLFGGKEGFTQFKKDQAIDSLTLYKQEKFTLQTKRQPVTETHNSYLLSVYNWGMNASGTTSVVAVNSSPTTKWCIVDENFRDVALTSANNSYVFTVINGTVYYLTGTLDSSVSLTSNRASAIKFTYDGSRLRPIVGGQQRYLYQQGSNIQIKSSSDTFQYSQSTPVSWTRNLPQYFLNTNGGSIQQDLDENTATLWVHSQRDADKNRIFATINGTDYYLNASSTSLSVSTQGTTSWAISEGNVLSTVIGGTTYYLSWTEEDGFVMSQNADTVFTLNTTRKDVLESKSYASYSLYDRYYSTNYYFNASEDGFTSTTSNAGAPIIFSNGLNNSGLMFFLVDGTPYYVCAASASALDISTDISEASVWMVSGTSSGTVSTLVNGATRYLYDDDDGWVLSRNSMTIYFTSAGQVNVSMPKQESSLTQQRVNNGVDIPETIVPLVTEGVSSYAATEKNYGYIVSGSNSVTEANLMKRSSITSDSDYGDIRIAKYPIGNIWNSVTGGTSSDFGSPKSTSYCTGKNIGIIGRSYRSDGYVHITDDFDSGSNGVSLPTKQMSYTDMGLTKYKDSRGIGNQAEDSGLVKLLKQQTGVYGLHYVQGLVSPTNTCVAEKVLIDNEEISQFEMPRDSIDFKLHDSGFVNFFAHTGYYNSGGPTNNSFFDLYEIDRSTAEDQSRSDITSIKKIQTIYGKLDGGFIDLSVPYIYVYDDNSTSDAKYPSVSALSDGGYSPIFEMDWITDYSKNSELTKSWKNSSIYYFEIPINAGEYALGAVSGGEGAYLMYLDLGGNAMRYDYSFFTEYAKIIENSFQYPLGVAIIQNSGSGDSAVKDSVNAANSVGIAILEAETVTFQKEKNTVTCDYDDEASKVNFIGINLVMKKAGQDPPVTAEGSVVKTTEYFRQTTVAYNITLKRYEITELTKTVVTPASGAVTTTYSGRSSVDKGANWAAMTAENAATAIAALNAGAGITDVSRNEVIVTFVAEVPYDENESLDPVAISFLLTYVEVEGQEITEKYQTATGYAFTVTNPSTTHALTVTVLDVLQDEQGGFVYVLSVNKTTITVVGQTVEVSASA